MLVLVVVIGLFDNRSLDREIPQSGYPATLASAGAQMGFGRESMKAVLCTTIFLRRTMAATNEAGREKSKKPIAITIHEHEQDLRKWRR